MSLEQLEVLLGNRTVLKLLLGDIQDRIELESPLLGSTSSLKPCSEMIELLTLSLEALEPLTLRNVVVEELEQVSLLLMDQHAGKVLKIVVIETLPVGIL